MEVPGVPKAGGPLSGAGVIAGAGVVARAGVAGAPGTEEEEAVAVSSKLFRCACVREWLPLAYREELYHVLRLTGPLLVSRILNFLLPFVITIFCGHLGNTELAGYALASATINVTTTSTGYGMGLACDTLVSQTYGSKNLRRVGVILQRSVLIMLLLCLPCWALLINAQNLLLLMQQEEEVARVAQIYVMAFLPAVPAMFMHQLQVAYLQNQGIILPQMYTAAAANLINLGVNYVLLFSLEMGVVGSAIANSLSQITICMLLYGYIRWRKLHLSTWEGWSSECLQDWGSYMQLAIPSTLMVCFEWWILEIGGFLAGMLGEVDLAAQHVMLELGAITYMFPLGVHAAACVRVGNALGAGDTHRALLTCKVSLVLSGILALFQAVVIFGSKSVIGKIFTDDENIVQIVADCMNIYTFLQFFDALLCVCSGILVGAGKQKIAALSNLVSYYVIGLPVGIALMFAAKLKIIGLWVGLLVCVVIQTVFFVILIFKLNWQKVTEEAQRRVGNSAPVICVPSKPPIGPPMSDTLLPEDTNSSGPAPNTTGAADSKPAGYSPVSTQDTELKAEGNGKGAVLGGGELDGTGESPSSKPAAPPPLSGTQLVLRRGVTTLVTVLILLLGVAFHVAFPPPAPSAHPRTNGTLDWGNFSSPAPLLEQTSAL
ncbi:multidrug and toxin extrusion protein 1-like [Aplochiton taeniatus]